MSKRNTWNGMSKIRGAALVLAWLGVGAWVRAGELDPPPGDIRPTDRAIINQQYFDTALPFVIDEPGSYVLTSNLTGVAGQHGIEVRADDVTIDLNGFALVGVPDSLNGVHVTDSHVNVQIFNGVVRDWGGRGVYAWYADNSQLRDLRAYANGAEGLVVGGNGLVSGCTAQENGGHGIRLRYQGTITNCTSCFNGNSGIFSGIGTTVTGCTSLNNAEDGFELLASCTVKACTAHSNNGRGIVVQVGSTVANCTAQDNSGDGIVANSSTIRHCTAQANGDDGIEVEFRCYVHDNNSSNNAPAGTGAGIRVTGRWNRIDGNQLTSCNKGLRVSNTDNIVIRNYASDNTTAQYDIDAGNDVGPIGTAASSMSPWANFAP